MTYDKFDYLNTFNMMLKRFENMTNSEMGCGKFNYTCTLRALLPDKGSSMEVKKTGQFHYDLCSSITYREAIQQCYAQILQLFKGYENIIWQNSTGI